MEAAMKVTKSSRKAKPSAKKSASTPQPRKPRAEIAEALRNLIEAAKAESDDSTLIAVMMPASLLPSELDDIESMIAEGMIGEGTIRKDRLGLLSPKELLKLHIVEMIYGHDDMPQAVLELIYLILRHEVTLDRETGELLAGLLQKIFFPSEELKKIIETQMEEERKSETPLRRRRPRYRRPPKSKG